MSEVENARLILRETNETLDSIRTFKQHEHYAEQQEFLETNINDLRNFYEEHQTKSLDDLIQLEFARGQLQALRTAHQYTTTIEQSLLDAKETLTSYLKEDEAEGDNDE